MPNMIIRAIAVREISKNGRLNELRKIENENGRHLVGCELWSIFDIPKGICYADESGEIYKDIIKQKPEPGDFKSDLEELHQWDTNIAFNCKFKIPVAKTESKSREQYEEG